MFKSEAYRDLTPVARVLLNELLYIHRPERNGYIAFGVRPAMKACKCGQGAITTAFRDLQSHGFIVATAWESYQQGLSREWKLTFREAYNKAPTHEWRRWDREAPYEIKTENRNKKVTVHRTPTPRILNPYTTEQKAIREISRDE